MTTRGRSARNKGDYRKEEEKKEEGVRGKRGRKRGKRGRKREQGRG